ncbi:clavesin-1-like [Anopheles ziemanni]|uniref:clavesin-1-like n=1 Tax=Anopheles coustani TaxID=139045 RepID=UPI002658CBBF|nr:clavesin-1-like [Anopheles coustani]XP_058178530.1 clavesin-1-like [Anopheles ziemanni]
MAPCFSPYSVEKNPSVYDGYKFELPELYRRIAMEELGEDDLVREQSLTEMRQWIVNNPHIRKCRTDAKFLLRFLRFRRFSVPMACEALERYLVVRELYPSWFKHLDSNDPTMMEIFDNVPFSVLGFDSAGRMVGLCRFARYHDQKHQPFEDGKYMAIVMETLLEWEETQIGGCQVFMDWQGISVNNLEKWNTTDLRIMMDAFGHTYPLRYGDIFSAKLPKFGEPTMDTFVSFANPKMREKITCLSSITEFGQQFEPNMKPKEYGGTQDLHALNRAFRKRVEEQREITLGLDQMEIDIDYYASVWNKMGAEPDAVAAGAIFKRLEIN